MSMFEAIPSASCASCANLNLSSPSFPRPALVWSTATPTYARTQLGRWLPFSSTPSLSSPMPPSFCRLSSNQKQTAHVSAMLLQHSSLSATRRPLSTFARPLTPSQIPTSCSSLQSWNSYGRMQSKTPKTRCVMQPEQSSTY